jgi:2-(1,2-epoxy-1,2-dihydrophenyl)acetyl-CoA isomerase
VIIEEILYLPYRTAEKAAMTLYRELRESGAEETRELVKVERSGGRAIVTLNDPERLNPLSVGLNLQLQERLSELAADPALRAIVLTGADPAFSAGGDLKMMAAGNRTIRDSSAPSDTSDAWRWIRRQFGGVARLIVNTDKLFVAALNGPAAGVGLAWAFACDIVIASQRAVLVSAFGRLGLVPEVGTSWLLTRRLGYQGAVASYLRGGQITATDALELGLVQEVHPHEELLAAAGKWCERAERLPSHAFEMTKPLLRSASDAAWEESLRLEEFAEANCFSTAALGDAARSLLEGNGVGERDRAGRQ